MSFHRTSTGPQGSRRYRTGRKTGAPGTFAALFLVAAALLLFAGVWTPAAVSQEERRSTAPGATQYREPGGEVAPGGSPELPAEVEPPEVGAGAWILTDAESGEVLAGADSGREVPMASTTKIMTALVALRNTDDLDEPVRVSPFAASFAIPEYSNAGLVEGDVLSVRELVLATLIVSGNDAATALAEHVGGGGREGVERFVGMMNQEARRLGLSETHFANPTGLDERDHHSSARDLAEMTRVALEEPLFRETVATRYASVTVEGAAGERTVELANLNELLYVYPGATGVKTGTSPGAGPSLVASATDGEGESYTSVVLDAPDRYGATVAILDYGFAAYERVPLVREGELFERVEMPYRRDERVRLVAARDVTALVDADSEFTTRTSVVEDLPDSAERGERLGEVVLLVDGERAGAAPLVAAEGYEEAGPLQRLGYNVSRLWN